MVPGCERQGRFGGRGCGMGGWHGYSSVAPSSKVRCCRAARSPPRVPGYRFFPHISFVFALSPSRVLMSIKHFTKGMQ